MKPGTLAYWMAPFAGPVKVKVLETGESRASVRVTSRGEHDAYRHGETLDVRSDELIYRCQLGMRDYRYVVRPAFYCTYCEFYGDEFIGSYTQVERHGLEHPINIEPESVDRRE